MNWFNNFFGYGNMGNTLPRYTSNNNYNLGGMYAYGNTNNSYPGNSNLGLGNWSSRESRWGFNDGTWPIRAQIAGINTARSMIESPVIGYARVKRNAGEYLINGINSSNFSDWVGNGASYLYGQNT